MQRALAKMRLHRVGGGNTLNVLALSKMSMIFSKAGGGGTFPFTIKPTSPGVIRRCSRLDTPGIVIMQTDIQIPITSPDFQELSIIFDFHNHCSKSDFKEYSIHLKWSLRVDEQRDGDG